MRVKLRVNGRAARLATVTLLPTQLLGHPRKDGHRLGNTQSGSVTLFLQERRSHASTATRPLCRRGIAVSCLAIAAPEQAAGYYVIRLAKNTGICQIWETGTWYKPIVAVGLQGRQQAVPTLSAAMAVQDTMRHSSVTAPSKFRARPRYGLDWRRRRSPPCWTKHRSARRVTIAGRANHPKVCPGPLARNNRLTRRANQSYQLAPSHPMKRGGSRSSRTRGERCCGRRDSARDERAWIAERPKGRCESWQPRRWR